MGPYVIREIFHLHFLRALALRLNGRPYALKGGCCLRFAHHSPRMSEDMDIDIQQVAPGTLQKIVVDIVASQAFRPALSVYGIQEIRLQDLERAKQTSTTQRWKLALVTDAGIALHAKVEFSRRQKQALHYQSAALPGALLRQRNMMPFVCQYYDAPKMVLEKLSALASDSRVALRDLFDLDLLISGMPVMLSPLSPTLIRSALQKVAGFTFGQFTEQVVPFLEDDFQTLYRKKTAFQDLRGRVARWIDGHHGH
jgi:predicted nucleotidyltransferase component of viral defense system